MDENKTIMVDADIDTKEDAAATNRERATSILNTIMAIAERSAENTKDIDKMRDSIAELTAAVNKINNFIANCNETFLTLNDRIKRIEEGSPKNE